MCFNRKLLKKNVHKKNMPQPLDCPLGWVKTLLEHCYPCATKKSLAISFDGRDQGIRRHDNVDTENHANILTTTTPNKTKKTPRTRSNTIRKLYKAIRKRPRNVSKTIQKWSKPHSKSWPKTVSQAPKNRNPD